MVQQLVPKFILEQMAQGNDTGTFHAISIFVDVSSFTPMATALMEYSSEGAEVLADVLDAVFAPLIDIIYSHGGFVATFAGDAFTALFPVATTREAHSQLIYHHAVMAAWQCHLFVKTQAVQHTRFGQFSFAVRLSIADGQVNWGIWQGTAPADGSKWLQRAAYYFIGEALDRCFAADKLVSPGEVVMTEAVFTALPANVAQCVTLEDHLHLLDLTQEDLDLPIGYQAPLSVEHRRLLNNFFPKELLERTTSGEFRRIVAVFVNLAECPSGSASVQFQHQLFQQLARYGGYLCSIGRIGRHDKACTLILYWGAPTSHEDDVMRALRFISELKQFSPTQIRTGITFHFGYAGFIGSIKRSEYTCYSVHVALAARQMTAANWGEVLVDQETATHTQSQFHLAEHSKQRFKGFSTELPVYLLGKQRDQLYKEQATVPFIGRQRELQELIKAAEPLWQGEFAGAVIITGEVGVGKSRLLQEFQQGLANRDLSNRVNNMVEIEETVAEQAAPLPAQSNSQSNSRSQSRSQKRPRGKPEKHRQFSWFYCRTGTILRQSLNPFRYLLYQYFEQASTNEEYINETYFINKFDALIAVTKDGALRAQLMRLRGVLRSFVGLSENGKDYVPDDPELRLENLQAAIKALFLAESSQQPVILQMEDAHLLDNDSITLLELLVRNVEHYPLLILLPMRIEQNEAQEGDSPAQSILRGVEPRQLLTLQPLSKYNLRRLAIHYLKLPPTPELLRTLDVRAKGNPFFAEQMLMYWYENDLLLWSDQGLMLKVSDETPFADRLSSVSPHLWSILIARLDRLPISTKSVVQTAAVLGHEFPGALLHRLLQQRKLPFEDIAFAEKAGIWHEVNKQAYRFHHALLCDTAYGMQSRAKLQELHRQAATAIEEHYKDNLQPHYAVLVYHYEKAGLIEPQKHYAKLAGDYAAGLFLNKEALHYYHRAIALTPDEELDERYQLSIASTELHRWLGNRIECKDEIEAQLKLATAANNQEWLAATLLRRADHERILGQYQNALRDCFDAVTAAEELESPQLKLQSHYLIGRILRHQGEHLTAHTYLSQGVEEAQDIGETMIEANCLHEIGHLFYVQAVYKDAITYYEVANQRYQELGYPKGQINCSLMFGVIHHSKGNFSEAADAFQRALVITRTIGWRPGEASCYTYLGNVYFDIGDNDTAREYHLQAHRLFKEIGDLEGEAVSLDTLGLILHREGLPTTAQTYYSSALTIQEALGDQHGEAYTRTHLGHAQLVQGKWSEARKNFQQAVAIRNRLGEKSAAIDSLAGLMTTDWQCNKLTEAVESAQTIMNWLNTNGVDGVEFPIQVSLNCFQVLSRAGLDQPSSEQLAQQALQTAYQLVMERAEQFTDPKLRKLFLTQIPANAMTIALWKRIFGRSSQGQKKQKQ